MLPGFGIFLRLEVHHGDIFKLPPHFLDAEKFRQRNEDGPCFQAIVPSLLDRKKFQRAHVVKAVGQLDERHTDVRSHGQEHLVEIRRIRVDPLFQLELLQFRHGVDKERHLVLERGPELKNADFGVFDDIVKDARRHRGSVKPPLCQLFAHGQRVHDCRFAGVARQPE